jgi:sporulation protein YlmC with PRC-barrel domain
MAAQNPHDVAPAAGPAPDTLPQTDVSAVSANDLVNTTVYSARNENVGEVGDVIVGNDGKIDAVVLDVGGFLGIGEKPVAIAFDALDIRKDTNGNLVLYTHFTKDQLDAAPTYDKNTYAAQRDTMRLANPS